MTTDTDKFRLLHTMIRVFDLDKSIDFYTNKLGMRLLRKTDFPSGEFTLAFVGYGDEENHSVIELTHNWGEHEYDIGTCAACSDSSRFAPGSTRITRFSG